MPTLEQLTLDRERLREASLEGPLQSEVKTIRDQIIAAKRAGDTAKVEHLTQQRTQLKAQRDASFEALNHAIKQAKKERRAEQVAAAARALVGLSDSELGNHVEALRSKLTQGRAELRVAVHEMQSRERRKHIRSLLSEMSEVERKDYIKDMLVGLSEEERKLLGVS